MALDDIKVVIQRFGEGEIDAIEAFDLIAKQWSKPDYCPCHDDQPNPCPACGATLSGNDPVHGVCQAQKISKR